ncbi:YesL family protein [Oceanobacillus sp. CFH 90083]|uniref:YesL family protein n=1 Tax=Oceanobacillus sp. CFH 90083 TaxID=2592336 RepID=UPI00128AEEC5|nr:DUF624 domain-containing protein [Oceanobacillus sp. CFH 90083]
MSVLSGFIKVFYDFGNWLAKMIYLQILWLIFTIFGLGLFGIIPATAAVTTVISKWFQEGYDVPIFQVFLNTYKEQFLRSNGLGIVLLVVGIFIYVDLNISKQLIQSAFIHSLLLLISLLYIVVLLYFFPVFVRYKLKYFQYFKQSFFIALARPFETIAMLLCILLLYYLFIYLPVLTFFAGASLTIFPITWFAHRAFIQLEEKS